jgi:hypothetical protein
MFLFCICIIRHATMEVRRSLFVFIASINSGENPIKIIKQTGSACWRRKPVEQFATMEKNASSRLEQMHYGRNVFWQCVGRLIRRGETVDTATMKIRQCYGQQLSVTATINGMIADRKSGGHPNLRWRITIVMCFYFI